MVAQEMTECIIVGVCVCVKACARACRRSCRIKLHYVCVVWLLVTPSAAVSPAK